MEKMIDDAERIGKGKGASRAQAALVFTFIIISAAVFSIVQGFPLIFMVSPFSLAISVVAAIRNDWLINSIAIPSIPLVFMAFINDIYMILGNITWDDSGKLGGAGSIAFHFSTWVLSSVVFASRENTSLSAMVATSIVYPSWILVVQEFIDPRYITSFFGGNADPGIVFVASLASCILFSIITTLKNSMQTRGNDVDCDGGWCPA